MECIEKRIDGELKYSGVIVKVRLDRAELENGKIVRREVVEHPGGVGILPVDEDGGCYLVRQFRYPFSRQLLEIPAGKLDYKGEDRLEAAKRELEEETGLTARSWTHLTDIFTTPGFSDEKISLYLARDLEAGKSHPDDDEFLNLVKLPLAELVSRIMKGEITDAKTVCAAMMAANICK